MSDASKVITSVKYAYLTVFFALLSGVFYPFIQGGTLEFTIIGIAVLFVGLGGTIMIYRASTSHTKQGVFMGIGFSLIAVSLFFILSLTGIALI